MNCKVSFVRVLIAIVQRFRKLKSSSTLTHIIELQRLILWLGDVHITTVQVVLIYDCTLNSSHLP